MKRFLPLTVLLGCIGGCASIGSGTAPKILMQIDDISTGTLQSRPVVIEHNGQPMVLYANKQNRVALRQGERVQLLDETARVQEGNHFQLHGRGEIVDVAWWSHQDGKNVYFSSSEDGGQSFAPASMVNNAHGVLPPFTVTRGPQGVVGVTYQDERQTNYQIYFNRSSDRGRTWATPDQRLDTPPANGRSSDVHEPQTVESNTVWVSAWTDIAYTDAGTRYRIMSRRSENLGENWSVAEELYSSERQISSLQVRAQGAQVVIAADDLSRGIVALTSQNNGRNWQQAGLLEGTDKASNSGVDIVLSEGRAQVVWMQDREGEKTRIMRGRVDVPTGKWLSAVQRLDVKANENTRSVSPTLIATSQGTVLATWVDYRDIRTNIYLSASYDQGQSWSAPQALLKPGEVAAGWPQLVKWGEKVAISYEIYPTDKIREGKLVIRLLPSGDAAAGFSGMPTPLQVSEAARKEQLEKRVKALWDARVSGNYAKAYEIFDFAYKATIPQKNYLENVGVITYLNFTVNDMMITGNEATVKTKIKYEVKPTMMMNTGKPITVPPIEVDSPSTWVWVANDWFLVYAPSFDPPQLSY